MVESMRVCQITRSNVLPFWVQLALHLVRKQYVMSFKWLTPLSADWDTKARGSGDPEDVQMDSKTGISTTYVYNELHGLSDPQTSKQAASSERSE